MTFSRNKSVYFKLTPEEGNKDKVGPLVDSWDHYTEDFKKWMS